MTEPIVRCEINGAVATVTLNRPEKLNAINDAMRDGLEVALRQLDEDERVRVVIIRGAGSAFCAGYDLTAIPGAQGYGPASRGNGPRPSIARDRERLRRSIERWSWMWNYRKPLIAQVHGYCIAGGGELAAFCDLTICADDAKFGHPAGRAIGIPMTLALWPVRIGMMKAKELLFTGDLIDGREAVALGLANASVPAEELDDHVAKLGARIALTPLDALTLHKHVVNRWFEIMGIRTCMSEGAEFNSIYHETDSARDFAEIARHEGLKAALKWRDSPYEK